MKITAKIRRELNKIAIKYSGWKTPQEFVKIYDELNIIGVEIPCWSVWGDNNAHFYNINGEEVENSRFVLSKYKGETKDEYNLYFS